MSRDPGAVKAGRDPGVEAYRIATGVSTPGAGLLVVGEGRLDEAVGEQVRERLAGWGTVVALAQDGEAAGRDPVEAAGRDPAGRDPVEEEVAEVATAWGSTVPARRGGPAALAIIGDLLGWAGGGAR